MIGHGLALDEFGSVVVLKGEGAPGGWTFVGDLADFWECGVHKRAAGLFLKLAGTEAICRQNASRFETIFSLEQIRTSTNDPACEIKV
jgi:hypothetical protein